MDKEQILAMEPGEAMNTLVAEKVMGWSKRYLPMSDMEYWFNPDSDDTVSMPWVKDWKPSEDIAAAWEVVEKIGGLSLIPAGLNQNGEISFWYAGNKFLDGDQLIEVNNTRNPTTGYGETAPEAICKAALLAILNKEDSA